MIIKFGRDHGGIIHGAARRGNDLLLEFTGSVFPDITITSLVRLIFGDLPGIEAVASKLKISLCGVGRGAGYQKKPELRIEGLFKPETSPLLPVKCGIDISAAYEDDFIIIVDKPKGIKIHPDSPDDTDSLANALQFYFHEKRDGRSVPRHIHRIDIGTSGLVIFAKDEITQALLDRMLFENRIDRKYIAEVEGRFRSTAGTINQPIARNRHVSNKYRVDEKGAEAITHYRVLSYDPKKNRSVLELTLETGRTHQIRVHMAHLKHPVIGDALYGSKIDMGENRFMLHSAYAAFIHPYTKKTVEVTSK